MTILFRSRPPLLLSLLFSLPLSLLLHASLPTAMAAAMPQSRSSDGTRDATRDGTRGQSVITRLAQSSDADLQRLYEAGRAEPRLAYRRYDADLAHAFREALSSGDPEQRRTVERVVRATLGDLPSRSPASLAARITERGSADPVNIEMRDAALHLAMLARLTGDPSQADRAAALLARFAEVIPKWPIWSPYSEEAGAKKPLRQDDPATFRSEFAAGLWGAWIYMDLMMGTPLVEANEILAPTGAVERTGATDAIRRMFDLHVQTQRKFNPAPDFSNMDGFQIRGYLDFGRLLPDPELVHEAVRRLRAMYRSSFYPDGWWHEGSIGYHMDLVGSLQEAARALPAGYSDPPGFKSAVDGTRFDDLDLPALLRESSRRANAVAQRMVMPDRTLMAVHDTPWPLRAPPDLTPPPQSHLFGALGQGTLISGEDDGLAMATLHWSASGSHAHADALNLNLWAKGTEAISETQYRPLPGSDSTRAWHTSTAGHATVVVNGVNQSPTGRYGSRMRSKKPEDAIPGIKDWRWRWTGCNAQDAGELRLFSTTFPMVQVIEADATRAYDKATGVTMYRRTIALVRIDDADSYVVDIFRIKGGTSADYMLRASLQMSQTLRLSVPVAAISGTEHTALRNLRSGAVDGEWIAAFEMENGVTLLTFMAGAPGTTVIQADGPAMRRVGDAPFVIARREGSETTFVAVHHVMRGSTPRVQGIELVPTPCAGCVALKVKVGARTDTILSCSDRSEICALPGGIEMRGLFAHIAQGATASDQWALLVDGDLLRTPDATIEGETSCAGTVRGTLSGDAGDRINGFIVEPAIPEGRTLLDSALIVDMAGEVSWAYRVDEVTAQDGASVIVTSDEPGFTVRDDGIKQTYFPGWGFKGAARFRVPGQAVARPAGAAAAAHDPPPTGSARAEWTSTP